MKTALKTALTAARKALAWYRMRSIEIHLAGALDTLPYIKDRDTVDHMRLSIRAMQRELCRARAHYQSFLPVGERMTWEVA